MNNCYKIIIAYDGTNYCGWQFQYNATSVQELVEKALATFLKSPGLIVKAAGRTDAGVHAEGQVAHFFHPEIKDFGLFLLAVNAILPADISIKSIEKAETDFHARYCARRKEYHYFIQLGRVMSPFRRLYFWQVYRELDVELLKLAAQEFIGTHDFTAFTNESHKGACSKNPVRTLYRIDIFLEGDSLRLEFEGNGFLYKMVRNIVGVLIDVATRRKDIGEIKQIFDSKSRCLSSKTAPARGLFLHKVHY